MNTNLLAAIFCLIAIVLNVSLRRHPIMIDYIIRYLNLVLIVVNFLIYISTKIKK